MIKLVLNLFGLEASLIGVHNCELDGTSKLIYYSTYLLAEGLGSGGWGII